MDELLFAFVFLLEFGLFEFSGVLPMLFLTVSEIVKYLLKRERSRAIDRKKEIFSIISAYYLHLLSRKDGAPALEFLSERTKKRIGNVAPESVLRELELYYCDEEFTVFSHILHSEKSADVKIGALGELLSYHPQYCSGGNLPFQEAGSIRNCQALLLLFLAFFRYCFPEGFRAICEADLPLLSALLCAFSALECALLLPVKKKGEGKNAAIRRFVLNFLLLLQIALPYTALQIAVEEAEKRHLYEVRALMEPFQRDDADSMLMQLQRLGSPLLEQAAVLCCRAMRKNFFHVSLWNEKNRILRIVEAEKEVPPLWMKIPVACAYALLVFSYGAILVKLLQVY